MVAQLIEDYYYLGANEKAAAMAGRMCDALMETISFYLSWGSLGSAEFETASRVLLYIADLCKQYGDTELGEGYLSSLETLLHAAS